MYHRLPMLLALTVALVSIGSSVAGADQWVAIQIEDQAGSTVEYYGQVSDADLVDLTAAGHAKAFVTLGSVCWLDSDGKLHPQHEEKSDDGQTLRGFTDATLFNVSRISRIVLVDKPLIGTPAPELPEPKPAKPAQPRDQDM